MKPDFFLALAHHLKTPVTAIRAAAEMLADMDNGGQPAKAKRLVSAILRSCGTLEKGSTFAFSLSCYWNTPSP